MLVTSLFVVTFLAGFSAEDCCHSKLVGGISYTLISQRDTTAYHCLTNCSYLKDGDDQDHAQYCFASGHEEVKCKDDATDPMTGTTSAESTATTTPTTTPATTTPTTITTPTTTTPTTTTTSLTITTPTTTTTTPTTPTTMTTPTTTSTTPTRTTITTNPTVIGCPVDWSQLQLHCYRAFHTYHTWTEAQKACQKENANLASIPNSLVNGFVKSLTSGIPHNDVQVYIGGYQPNPSNGKWAWIDGSSWTYTAWANTGQPDNGDNGDEDCLSMFVEDDGWGKAGYWNDHVCSVKLRYICAKPANMPDK